MIARCDYKDCLRDRYHPGIHWSSEDVRGGGLVMDSHSVEETPDEWRARVKQANLEEEWCLALHGNHDEHQCHKKPNHQAFSALPDYHECYCGVWW